MKGQIALLLVACLAVQAWGMTMPAKMEYEKYQALVSDLSQSSARMVRSLMDAPKRDAEGVRQQLQDELKDARRVRSKREAPASDSKPNEGLQNFFANVNEGLKAFMSNASSSPIFKEVQKLGESFGEKGKELLGKLEDQVKNLQQSDPKKE